MIFVTVGTHEQSFKRLIQKVDNLIENGTITEEVFMQTGYTKDYTPKNCEYKEMLTNTEMNEYNEKSRIIITHGGPGSIMLPFQLDKVPIVVPRNPEFAEHVDEHQMLFTKKLSSQNKVIAVYDIEKLEDVIVNYDKIVKKLNVNFQSTTSNFVNSFEKEINMLFEKKKHKIRKSK